MLRPRKAALTDIDRSGFSSSLLSARIELPMLTMLLTRTEDGDEDEQMTLGIV
jgi:hypothetical protein